MSVLSRGWAVRLRPRLRGILGTRHRRRRHFAVCTAGTARTGTVSGRFEATDAPLLPIMMSQQPAVATTELRMIDAPPTRASLLVRIRDGHNHEAWRQFVQLY